MGHWLTRPESIRRLWIGFIVVLAVTVLAETAIEVEGHFGLDGSFAFNAWYGFAACAGLVAFAKVLSVLLKRGDRYYGG